MKRILVINTGSTSTKVAVFSDSTCILQGNLTVSEEELKRSRQAVDQLPYRTRVVSQWLEENGFRVSDFDMIAARGGPLPPVKHGAYMVNQLMVDVLTYAPVSRHESALSCMIGASLAAGTDTPVMIYDSVSVDEMYPVAKRTGMPGITFRGGGHILNTRRVGKLVARQLGRRYDECTFLIAHLGGSITVTAHDRGQIVDTVNAYTGPMSTQRAGRIPSDDLVRLCFSGKYTQQELLKLMNGGSGYKAYFGTQDARRVSALMDAGDPLAKEVTDTLAYQTSKAVAEMRIAAEHPVDRIIITGGMANFKYVTDYITRKVSFIAPVVVRPGAIEMDALARGILRVLRGEEGFHTFAEEY